MSGGQKQRVAIARALVKRPTIVLADEPTANLDSANGAAIIALMRRMQAEQRTTFIFSTHDPQLMSHSEETFGIRDGMLVAHEDGRANSSAPLVERGRGEGRLQRRSGGRTHPSPQPPLTTGGGV